MRMRSHSPALSGPGRSQIAFDTPSRPKPCTSPARRSISTSSPGSPSLRPASPARSATATEWPRVNGDFRSTKFAMAASALSSCASDNPTASAGSAAITVCHAGMASRPPKMSPARAYQRGQRRVELLTCLPPGERRRALDSADAVRYLQELRELRHPCGHRHCLAAQVTWPAPSVPLLVRRADRLAHLARKLKLFSQHPGQPGMLGDHPVQLAMPGQGKLEPDPEPVQRRIPGADQPHGGQRPAQAAEVMGVFAGLQLDVVAEPPGLLMRVRMTADIDQQSGVVDRHPVLLTERGVISQPQRDQALAQDVFHGLAEPEVHAQRQRRDQLTQPDLRLAGTAPHQQSLTCVDPAAGLPRPGTRAAGVAEGRPGKGIDLRSPRQLSRRSNRDTRGIDSPAGIWDKDSVLRVGSPADRLGPGQCGRPAS